ncbi:hypothetical protein Tco_0754912 [Tanacetum coccineum]
MDNVRPRGSCSPIKRSYYTKLAFRPKDLKQDVKTFGVKNMTTAGKRAVVITSKGKLDTDLVKSRWVWRPKGNPEILLQDHAVVDSGCSSHMTSNKAYLLDYEDFNGGFMAFGSDPKGETINKKRDCCAQIEGEEPEDQGRIIQDINDDPLVSLVRESMKENSIDFVTPTKALGEAQEEEIIPTILEAAKTLSKVASQSVSKTKSTDKGKRYRRRARSMAKKINTELDVEDEINTGRVEINSGIEDVNTGSSKVDTGRTSISTSSIIHSPKKGQREGKAQMVEEDIQATHKTKEQIRQEEAGLEEAIRLQAQMDEEVAKQIHLDKMLAKRVQEEQELSEQQLKRKAEVQKAAQFYTEEDWDTIRAKLEANTEVVKSLQGESISNDDFAKRMVEMINEKKKFYAEQKAKAKRSTQDSYVAGSSGKDKEPTQEYILLPLHPHRTRIPVEDVAPAAHEKPSESSPKDNDVQDSEDVADKEGQHQMTEDEQVLHDELKKMIAQEVVAKALDDATRQAFKEEKRNVASQKRATQATSINKISTIRSSVSTATTPYV